MQVIEIIFFLARIYLLLSLWLVSNENFILPLQPPPTPPKKPTRWGICIHVLADSASSCVCMFIPYDEKITTECLIKPDLLFTSLIVLQLFHNMRETWPDITGYHCFTDQFYNSPTLVSDLSKVRCHLTGTVMNNRKDVVVLMKKLKLKKGEEYHTGMIKAFYCWHVVTLIW
jgi:hypothetical protein